MTPALHHCLRIQRMYGRPAASIEVETGSPMRKYGEATLRPEGVAAALRLFAKYPRTQRSSLCLAVAKAVRKPVNCGLQISQEAA